MNRSNRAKLTGGLIAGLLLAMVSMGAQAAQTAAGQDITNTASVAYKVNNVVQTAKPSNQATFKVDAKLILSVTKQDSTIVTTGTAPGSTAAVTTFKVQNDGNQTQDVVLSAANLATGSSDPFGNTTDLALTTSALYVDTNNNGTYDAGTDTAVSVLSNLAAGAYKTVFIVASIPSTATDAQIAGVGLLAKVGTAGSGVALASDDSAAAWSANTVQNIFAEPASTHPVSGDSGANDGAASDTDAYKVKSAALTVSKTSAVITDPIACTTAGSPSSCGSNIPHAIPGAVVEYTITVSNASGASDTATNVAVSDSLNTEITSGHLAYNTNSINVQATGVNSGNAFACADGTTVNTIACAFSGNTVTAGEFTLAASGTATVKFRVTIQ